MYELLINFWIKNMTLHILTDTFHDFWPMVERFIFIMCDVIVTGLSGSVLSWKWYIICQEIIIHRIALFIQFSLVVFIHSINWDTGTLVWHFTNISNTVVAISITCKIQSFYWVFKVTRHWPLEEKWLENKKSDWIVFLDSISVYYTLHVYSDVFS